MGPVPILIYTTINSPNLDSPLTWGKGRPDLPIQPAKAESATRGCLRLKLCELTVNDFFPTLGIGKETALDLSRRGARVIMACRNLKLATAAADDIKKETDGSIEVMQLDLADLESVRECAQTIVDKEDRVDVLINNAGVMMCPYLKTKVRK